MTLIVRLSKLDGPDREVDAELEALFIGGRVHYNDPANKEAVIERPIDGLWIRGIYPYRKIARYTASVDAAIALAERVLPGWTIARLGQDDNKQWNAELRQGHLTAYDRVTLGGAPNGAIALCIAILRAKEAST
ncbi:hypothetical protein [Brucella sp. NBRC 12950]|uniref:hypothetical protein n=1 Tax=Brucella sp. NBRC 12950 TaxID=2994518 RepID=UPI0024A412FF|nr:hypothetical protein [Brucella sp. NBRC 12950]GLU26675.1 hypothetical protein Brsp01_19080 [Brucella sp. NBRC 12950]